MDKILLKAIRFYQKVNTYFVPSKVFERGCRFYPTCSEYTYQAIERYDTIKGLFLGLKRIVRCHPFSKGGNDPVK